MKYQLAILFIGLNAMFVSGVSASVPEPDTLWLKVIFNMKTVEKWAAQNIEMSLKSTNKAGSKEVKISKIISSWDKDVPIYSNVSITPPPSDPKKVIKSFGIDKIIGPVINSIIRSEVRPSRSDQVIMGDKICTMFVVKQGTLPRVEMKFWVQPNTGAIYQYTVDAYVPFGVDAKLTTIFKMDEGGNLPQQTITKADILTPFNSSKLDMLEIYSHWKERPVIVKTTP
jgi:hypothetical protein